MGFEAPVSLGNIVMTGLAGALIALGFGGSLYFQLGKDVALKRKLLPRFVIYGSIALAFLYVNFRLQDPRLLEASPFLIFIALFFAICAWVSIKSIKFCDKCGSANYPLSNIHPLRLCLWCGADLSEKIDHFDNDLS